MAPSAPRPPPKAIRLQRAESAWQNITTLGQKRLLHEDFYHSVLLWPWWKFFLFVFASFLGANALFALLFMAQPGAISNARDGSFEDAFFFSVQTLATIGYGAMSPATLYGHVVVTLEAVTGILGVALVTGLAFSKFARPTARVLFSERVVVSKRNGVPHVMFRMANWRHNTVVEATLRVNILLDDVTEEGDKLRKLVELPLVKDRSAMFILTWTAMHLVDEKSPFYGPNALENLRAKRAELMLSFNGIDETFGQNIHARYRYTLEHIAWNARFVDVLTVEGEKRVIDYSKFHDVEPQG
jgi:inward rectifier potassium channel